MSPESRYAKVPTAQHVVPGTGRTVAYGLRRRIPDLDDQPVLAEHRVAEGERLDLVAATYTGDPQRFWMLCDANRVLDPSELEVVGRVIRIVMGKG